MLASPRGICLWVPLQKLESFLSSAVTQKAHSYVCTVAVPYMLRDSLRNAVIWLGEGPGLSAHSIEDRGTGFHHWADSFHFFQIPSSGAFSSSSCLYALKRDVREKTRGQFSSLSRSLYNGEWQ